jgi:HPt (histidine-containing phosphotransfer) domain-containing protein
MARPIDMQDLIQCINDLTINASDASIFSELNPNSNSSELIGFFVEQTKTAARELGDALAADDLEAIRRTCRNLKSTAGGYGFSGVAEAARHADTALATATQLADAAKQVQYLMSLLKRVKGGYAPPKAA